MKPKATNYQNQYHPLLRVLEDRQQQTQQKTGPLQPAISPITSLFNASGLYSWKSLTLKGLPDTAVLTPPPNLSFTWGIGYEALRLDVDGHHPQMLASGTVKNLFHTLHWLAHLEPLNDNSWVGNISNISGDTASFAYTAIQITAVRSMFSNQRKLNVTFSGDGVPDRHNSLKFESAYFQQINLAFDFMPTPDPVTAVASNPSANQQTTITECFQEAGFDVTITSREVLSHGADTPWHDQELHDAMQFYWANSNSLIDPALWVFFASSHQTNKQVGATIYDNIGLNHGQGTAVFTNSFIAQPPGDISQPADWLRLGLTCRQIGAALHSPYTKPHNSSQPLTPHSPHTDQLNDYFSPRTLQAMRHTTKQYAISETADWYDEQGFDTSPDPSLRLELRVNRDWPTFEFMEPVILEFKVTNQTTHPQWLDQIALTNLDNLTLIIKKKGQAARQFLPYKRDYQLPQPQQLMPGQSLYDSLFISTGLNGWQIAQPGHYTIQAAWDVCGKATVSNPLHIQVLRPTTFTAEYLAQDYFTDDVGRILAFNGSRYFHSGNQVLREIMACLPQQRISLHAAYALGQVLTYDYKRLALAPPNAAHYLQIVSQPSQVKEARRLLQTALSSEPQTAVTTFGHIRWRQYMEQFSLCWLNKATPS